ncbi:MAG: DUF4160 domain-containing protein [Proteobacteria bacterium]|nr:DUF4160 domain-containing protein [Pseudomonadota bacterium]
MPEISRFYGVIIRMYSEIGGSHHSPHFHAYYQGYVGIFSLDSVELIAGELPKRQQRLVEAWAELHQAELLQDWTLLAKGCKPLSIKPLS